MVKMKTRESSYLHLFEAGPLSLSLLTKENRKCHVMLWKNSFLCSTIYHYERLAISLRAGLKIAVCTSLKQIQTNEKMENLC